MTALGGIDVTQVRLAPGGKVHDGAVGAAAPTDSATAMTSAWTDLGYVTDAGVTITPMVNFGEVMAWQSATPLKRPLDKVEFEIAFKIMQTNKAVTALFFNSGTWVNNPAGVASMNISSNPTYAALERALTIDWTDDSTQAAVTRLYVPRSVVTKRDPLVPNRKNILEYGLTYTTNDSNGSLGTLFSNSTSLYSS